MPNPPEHLPRAGVTQVDVARAERRRYDPAEATANTDRALEGVADPRHRAILLNYRRHGLLETTGNWERILTPELTVDEPHYRITEGGRTHVFDGRDEVAAFYESLKNDGLAPLFGPIVEEIMVSDWGFSAYGVWGHQIPGAIAAQQGIEVDDPDAFYYLTHIFTMVWIYDEDVRLVSENVFEDLGSRQSWKLDPSEVMTVEEAYGLLVPQLEADLQRDAEPSSA